MNEMTPAMRRVMAINNFGRGIEDKEKFELAIKQGKIGSTLFDKLANGEERLYNPTQVSEMTGIDIRLIYRWCRTGVIENAFKVGKLWFIPHTDMQALFERDESKMGE